MPIDVAVASVKIINAPTEAINIGVDRPLYADVRNGGGGRIDTASVAWTVSDTAVLFINTWGVMHGVRGGHAYVIATSRTRRDSASVDVYAGATIGVFGGSAGDGMYDGVSVVAAPGAFTRDTRLTLALSTVAPTDSLLVRYSVLELHATPAAPDAALTLTMPYNLQYMRKGTSGSDLRVVQLVGAEWVPVPEQSVDLNTRLLTARIRAEGTFALRDTRVGP
ncbi:MAG: hypothetical protein JWO05_3844 [Gemmatimonadetes bacterium]|nr:hypothetical protein [Gemmatimonadota bacterium]